MIFTATLWQLMNNLIMQQAASSSLADHKVDMSSKPSTQPRFLAEKNFV